MASRSGSVQSPSIRSRSYSRECDVSGRIGLFGRCVVEVQTIDAEIQQKAPGIEPGAITTWRRGTLLFVGIPTLLIGSLSLVSLTLLAGILTATLLSGLLIALTLLAGVLSATLLSGFLSTLILLPGFLIGLVRIIHSKRLLKFCPHHPSRSVPPLLRKVMRKIV
jgi:hypothetical protein